MMKLLSTVARFACWDDVRSSVITTACQRDHMVLSQWALTSAVGAFELVRRLYRFPLSDGQVDNSRAQEPRSAKLTPRSVLVEMRFGVGRLFRVQALAVSSSISCGLRPFYRQLMLWGTPSPLIDRRVTILRGKFTTAGERAGLIATSKLCNTGRIGGAAHGTHALNNSRYRSMVTGIKTCRQHLIIPHPNWRPGDEALVKRVLGL